jgi:hypothetical protein
VVYVPDSLSEELTRFIDYASVVLVVMLLLGLANWYAYARKHYHGPRLEM